MHQQRSLKHELILAYQVYTELQDVGVRDEGVAFVIY
jgi:hypothetical protein